MDPAASSTAMYSMDKRENAPMTRIDVKGSLFEDGDEDEQERLRKSSIGSKTGSRQFQKEKGVAQVRQPLDLKW